MKDIWIRADSTFSNANRPYNTRPAYLLAQTVGCVVHDDASAGMMICRRAGFPKTPFSAGLADFKITCVNVHGKYKFTMMGVNDYDNSKTLKDVLNQQKQWGDFVLSHNCIPWIISPLSTANELVDRPNLPSWRTGMQNQCIARGYKYIDGTTLLDINLYMHVV